jgi:hypothetical protein
MEDYKLREDRVLFFGREKKTSVHLECRTMRTEGEIMVEGNKEGGRGEELDPAPVFIRLRTKTPNVIVPAHPVRLPGPTVNSGGPLHTVLFVFSRMLHD